MSRGREAPWSSVAGGCGRAAAGGREPAARGRRVRAGRRPAYRGEVHQLDEADFEHLLTFRISLRRFLHWSECQARAVGLTPAQHQLLVAIKGHPGPQDPTISDLAGYLLLRHHSTVELVDRAAAVGLVRRLGDAEDGRITRVRLTADGQARLSRLAPAHLDELRNLAPALNRLLAGWTSGG